MKWEKLGRLFNTKDLPEGFVSHAQVPTPIIIENVLRVYFASRDINGKSHTLFIDFDMENKFKILHFEKKSILCLGNPGSFDDDGVMPGCAIKNGENIWLYYSGWNQKVKTPYHNSTGLAHSEDGRFFERIFEGPILDRTKTEPYLAVTPSILIEDNIWKMWYISGLKWTQVEDKYEPVYTIKYADSSNGIDWNRYPEIVIEHKSEDEVFSHPTISKIDGTYHMWFSYRKIYDYRGGENGYNMGYAFSIDGLKWHRDDNKSGITKSKEKNWDSEMICYPSVFNYKNDYYMVYNGNYFGKSGFGIAKLKKN